MAIRQTVLSWSNYKKAAKTIKTINPGTTPQQIIGQLGYPVKNGQRIYITSDGQGGVKERNRTAHKAREAVRQKRLRIQTGKLTPEEAAETRLKKDTIRAAGNEADHFNESWLIGEQLERLKAAGGDVDAALERLKKAGYKLGNHPENIQSLSPEANKEKYQQNRDLQDYLGSREALGRSPSAGRTDLIETNYTPPTLGGFQTEKPRVTNTGGTITFKPEPLEGIKTDAAMPQQTPVTPKQDLSQPVLNMSAEQVRDAVGFNSNVQAGVGKALQLINGTMRFGKALGGVAAAMAGMK